MQVNSTGTFNDWLESTCQSIATSLGINLPVLYEAQQCTAFPSVTSDYYMEHVWSPRRLQYYDALMLHVRTTDSDTMTARKICQQLDIALNLKEGVSNPVMLAQIEDIDSLTDTELASPTPVIPLLESKIEVRANDGWKFQKTDTLRHYWRDLSVYYN